jgi:hypothetical protein
MKTPGGDVTCSPLVKVDANAMTMEEYSEFFGFDNSTTRDNTKADLKNQQKSLDNTAKKK